LVGVCESWLEYRCSLRHRAVKVSTEHSCWILGGSATCASLDYARLAVRESLNDLSMVLYVDILTSEFAIFRRQIVESSRLGFLL
jgi:hypothetical protein